MGQLGNDPGMHVASWLTSGAPAGVKVDFNLDGLLQPADGEHPTPVEELEPPIVRGHAQTRSDDLARVGNSLRLQQLLRESGEIAPSVPLAEHSPAQF